MLLFGTVFSLFSGRASHRSILTDPYFWHGLFFISIFNAAVLYAAVNYPDWMWMYFIKNAKNTNPELIYIFVFLYYFPFVLGFFLGYDLKRISNALCYLFIIAMLGTEAWLMSLLFDRYSVIGTLAEFHSGQAVSLFSTKNPLYYVLNGSIFLMIIYFVLVLYLYRKQNRQLA